MVYIIAKYDINHREYKSLYYCFLDHRGYKKPKYIIQNKPNDQIKIVKKEKPPATKPT